MAVNKTLYEQLEELFSTLKSRPMRQRFTDGTVRQAWVGSFWKPNLRALLWRVEFPDDPGRNYFSVFLASRSCDIKVVSHPQLKGVRDEVAGGPGDKQLIETLLRQHQPQ